MACQPSSTALPACSPSGIALLLVLITTFGISERDTLKTWTVLESVLSVAGFAVAAVVSVFV
ncbi:hypothetical protein [Streptomyces chiangmaiensis]|uniref:Uncharacterized protein n=1 Tax=Streptomyces chiangmaiensis TaxID=766497 RepID=A0ABU7FAZ5_9ACTN|nr:hypothetical protein [Streptomyces chiangmaiensis]MED7821146.1 hypothetical protein [Streptomyces chiangmaiensis]